MASFTVTAPVPDYNGEVGSVRFSGGIAVMDEEKDAPALAYCRASGYGVAPVGDDATEEDEAQKPARRTRSSKETNA
jgi:hypothetical protein